MLEARRLTGRNVLWDRPSAVVDVALSPVDDAEELVAAWSAEVAKLLRAVGWSDEQTISHRFAGGVSLAFSAPVDRLYSAVEIAEWAYHRVTGTATDDFEQQVEHFKQLIDEEAKPRLLEIADECRARNVAFLWDDDEVSVGLGVGSKTWPADALPDTIDWTGVHDIPVGLVTGTNGKTTTVRLCTHILRAAGHSVGLSSTDWIGVNDDVIDRGDYSGPGGARTVLRQREVTAAVLETARGGLLRRGLGVDRADAALITNIAEDHLGDFGSQNLDELLDLKWIVTQAIDDAGVVVLNAEDKLLVAKANSLTCPIVWFSLGADDALLQRHVAAGGQAVTVKDNAIARHDKDGWAPARRGIGCANHPPRCCQAQRCQRIGSRRPDPRPRRDRRCDHHRLEIHETGRQPRSM